MNIWDNDTYISDIGCIINIPIYEYDIRKANISILLDEGVIDKHLFDVYASLPKIDREINIGLLQRSNPKISKYLSNGYANARKNIIVANNIKDNEIVNIRKDALFVVRKLNNIDFENIHFIEKNIYRSYYKLKNLVIFHINKTFKLVIKGIDDNVLKYHQKLLNTITEIIILSEIDIKKAIEKLRDILVSYSTMNLDVDYYREFNSDSLFKIQHGIVTFVVSDALHASAELMNLDISYNQCILEELYQLLLYQV
jgi:hypothetical protein